MTTAADSHGGVVEGYLKPSFLPGELVILPPVYRGTAVTIPAPVASDLTCLSCGGTGVSGSRRCEDES